MSGEQMPFDWKAWFGSAKIRSLSPMARCLYVEIIGLIWISDEKGYLSIAGKPMSIETISRMLGMKSFEVAAGLKEIDRYSLLPKTGSGIYFSRKIVESQNKKTAKQARTFMSFEEYIAEEMEAYCSLIVDEEWIEERKKYHPGINILLSMDKAHKEYWSTKAGYECKKASKVEKINWKNTYANAIGLRQNKVWLSREESNASENDYLLSRLKEIKI